MRLAGRFVSQARKCDIAWIRSPAGILLADYLVARLALESHHFNQDYGQGVAGIVNTSDYLQKGPALPAPLRYSERLFAFDGSVHSI